MRSPAEITARLFLFITRRQPVPLPAFFLPGGCDASGFFLEPAAAVPAWFRELLQMEQAVQPEESNYPYAPCRKCERWDAVKERIRIKELVEKAIANFESDISRNNFKPSIAEFLKLMTLEKEAEQEEIKEIKVTWVGPTPQSERSE